MSASIVEKEYLVNNGLLSADTEGLAYRYSKQLSDKAGSTAFWWTTIKGVDEGDGWLRTHAAGVRLYLPINVNGVKVLTAKDDSPIPKLTEMHAIARGTSRGSSPGTGSPPDSRIRKQAALTGEVPAPRRRGLSTPSPTGPRLAQAKLSFWDTGRSRGLADGPLSAENLLNRQRSPGGYVAHSPVRSGSSPGGYGRVGSPAGYPAQGLSWSYPRSPTSASSAAPLLPGSPGGSKGLELRSAAFPARRDDTLDSRTALAARAAKDLQGKLDQCEVKLESARIREEELIEQCDAAKYDLQRCESQLLVAKQSERDLLQQRGSEEQGLHGLKAQLERCESELQAVQQNERDLRTENRQLTEQHDNALEAQRKLLDDLVKMSRAREADQQRISQLEADLANQANRAEELQVRAQMAERDCASARDKSTERVRFATDVSAEGSAEVCSETLEAEFRNALAPLVSVLAEAHGHVAQPHGLRSFRDLA